MEILLTFARLWGQYEATRYTPEDERLSDEMKAWDSEELAVMLTEI